MMVMEVSKVWDRWSQRQGMIIFDGGGDFLLMRHVRVAGAGLSLARLGARIQNVLPPKKVKDDETINEN